MMISTSEIKVSCVIDAKYAELAVRVLHDVFGLEEPPPAPEPSPRPKIRRSVGDG